VSDDLRSTRYGNRASRLVALALALALAGGAVPVAALTIDVPTEVSAPVDVPVRLDAGEPTGTVVLRDGDVTLGETSTVDGVALFPGLVFEEGDHTLGAVLTSAEGATFTARAAPFYAWGAPGAPTLVGVRSGTVVSPLRVKAEAGASTATMTISLNGKELRSYACREGDEVNLGKVKLTKGRNLIEVTAVSLTGETTVTAKTVKRKEWPYKTCIVIDKSEYNLYWVRNQQLVKTYKVAHGKYNWTPVATWKILAKYKTDPKGVYGPRKMRMFRRVGTSGHYRFIFTAYGIHGTNEPWVIGTQASHGCIRMYNKDVLELWPQVPLGTYCVTRA